MSFAGSRSVVDRRRRRLASGGESASTTTDRQKPSVPLADLLQRTLAGRSLDAIPGLPRRGWVLGAMISLSIVALAIVLALRFHAHHLPDALHPLTSRLTHGDDPLLARTFEVLGWLFAGQLCLLIGWCRSQSQLDFKGRYRVWPWTAMLCLAVSAARALDLHLATSELALAFTGWRFWNARELMWMVCTAGLFLITIRALARDVSASRGSRWLLRAVAVLVVMSLIVKVAVDRADDKQGGLMLLASLRLITAYVIGLFAWFHLRHVVYVSADPPAVSADAAPGHLTVMWGRVRSLSWRGAARKTAKPAEAPKRRRRTTKTENAEGETTPVKKPRKKTTTPRKKTTTSRPRRRVAAEAGQETYDDAETPAEEYVETADAAYEDSTESYETASTEPTPEEIQRAIDEEDWEKLEALTRPAETESRNESQTGTDGGKSSKKNRKNKGGRASQEDGGYGTSNDESDSYSSESYEDDEGGNHNSGYTRIDQGHEGGPRGMSKRERREAKRQQKGR